ncbi:MAG: response regulator [Williamsia sp.]|nr:response regulator [Williamsia sp.]
MEAFKILLVDDDPDDASIIADVVKDLRSDVHLVFADNGEIAVEMLNENPELQSGVSLIVLDLNMPKMNGTQTLMSLKNDPRFNTIPVVIYSTSINDLEKERCLSLGAHSYITKPLSYKESLDTVSFFIELCKARSIA